jgi:Protein of unknown function (DUF1559)
MSVKLHCPKCNAPIRVPQELAGSRNRVACPKCGTKFVPAKEAGERGGRSASEAAKARPAIEKAELPKLLDEEPTGGARSSLNKWILLTVGAGAAFGMMLVILVIVLLGRRAIWPDRSSVAQPDASALTESTNPSPAAPLGESSPATASSSPKGLPLDDSNEVQAKLKALSVAVSRYHIPIEPRGPQQNRTRAYMQAPGLSWRVKILPELGQTALYDRFHLDEQWDSPNNKPLLDQMPDEFRLGASKTSLTRFRAYTGAKLVFRAAEPPTRIRARDGVENTAMLVVAGPSEAVPWTKPDDLLIGDNPVAALGQLPGGQIELVMLDGNLLTLPADVDPKLLGALITPNGGEVVDGAALRAGRGIRRTTDVAAALKSAEAAALLSEKSFTPPDPAESAAKLGRALQQYIRVHRAYPISRRQINGKFENGFDFEGRPLLSWRVHLLPFLGQQALYDQFNQAEPWDSPHNKSLLASMPEVFRTGSRDVAKTQWHMLFGKDALTDLNRNAAPQHVRDGTSNTIAFVLAAADRADFWTRPYDLPFELDKPLAALGKIESAQIHCVMANGQPAALPADIPAETFAALVTPNGGDVVDIGSLKRQAGERSGKRLDPADPQVAERQTESLRRLSFSLRNFRTSFGQFPMSDRPEYLDDRGRPKLSWRVHLLPLLDQRALYSKFKLDEPWDSENNRPLLANMPDIFRAPEDSADSQKTRLLMVHVEGEPLTSASPPASQTGRSRRTGRRNSAQDRLHPRILIAQVGPDRAVPWTKPDELEVRPDAPMAGLGTLPSSGFSVLMSNGRIYRLKSRLPPELFKSLASGVDVAALENALGDDLIELPKAEAPSDADSTTNVFPPAASPARVGPNGRTTNGAPPTAPSATPPPDPVVSGSSRLHRPGDAAAKAEPVTNPPLDRLAVQDIGLPPGRRPARGSVSATPASRDDAARTATPALDMPDDYADFALDPESGDILALCADKGDAVLFRGKDLDARKIEPAAKVHVGSNPCAAFFKRYHELRVFAVVCPEDAHMHLISASDGKLLEKIELSQAGLTHVTGSINPDDPFVYYNYGQSLAGVVNLRLMRDEGVVSQDSMDCALSASGEIAYRRGPWSPHGFESLLRTNSFAENKPTFSRLFYEHTSDAEYVPDPFDRYTAVGNKLYSRSLEQIEATLDFTPACFFKTRPVIIGVPQPAWPPRPLTGSTLYAASYNTFTRIGRPISLSLRAEAAAPNVVIGGDFRRVGNRTRVFADDARNRVIFAARGQIYFVPLDEFKLAKEPFMTATLVGSDHLPIGQQSARTVKLSDPQVSMTFDKLPDGMQANGNELKWSPREDQIGRAQVTATLQAGELRRTTTFDLHVVYPGVTLPFNPAGLAAAPDGTRALVWTDLRCDQPAPLPPGLSLDQKSRIATIDSATGRVLAEHGLSEAVQRGLLTADYAVLTTGSLSPRCEVLRASDLKRETVLMARSPIERFDVVDKLLVIQTNSGTEIYEMGTFKRLRVLSDGVMGRGPNALQNGPTSEGLVANGMLFDAELKPRLLLTPWPIAALAGGDPLWRPKFATKNEIASHPPVPGAPRTPFDQIAAARLPDSDTLITLSMQRQTYQPPRSALTNRFLVELTVAAKGEANAHRILYRGEGLVDGQRCSTGLFVAPGIAYVVFNRVLYRWPVQPDAPAAGEAQPLRLAAHQSAFALDEKGKTILKHAARGGKLPYKFAIATPFDGMRMDEKSGDLTIDGPAMRAEALHGVAQAIVRGARPAESLLDTLEFKTIPAVERATLILGHKPAGTPAAIPIFVEVQDAESNSDSLQYYVLAEVSTPDLKQHLRQLDEERAKAAPPPSTDRASGNETKKSDAGKPSDDVADLKRRVEGLEERLDLVTRQLNELLKKPNGK